MDTLIYILGLGNTGYWYGFWSGIGSDLSLFGAGVAFYLKHQCHVKRCGRIARVPIDGLVVCWKHHPNNPPSAADVKGMTNA